jgi:transcriptional regulator with XRE-family HTH domain
VRVATNGVGAAVRDRRRVLGISQTELGRRAGGLTQDYISKLENGIIETPQRGTMDALAGALAVPVAVLYRAAGILEGVDESPAPAPPPDNDHRFDPALVVAFVESKPDETFQAQLARQKARRTPESYTRLCLRLYRAWTSNADLLMGELETVGQG